MASYLFEILHNDNFQPYKKTKVRSLTKGKKQDRFMSSYYPIFFIFLLHASFPTNCFNHTLSYSSSLALL